MKETQCTDLGEERKKEREREREEKRREEKRRGTFLILAYKNLIKSIKKSHWISVSSDFFVV